MRYLIASDLHFALPQFDWIVEQAADFDAVILSGDHLDAAGHVEIHAQASLIGSLIDSLLERTIVVVSSGNHDLIGRGDHGEKVALWLEDLDPRVVRDGQAVRIGDDLVSACCWWEGPTTKAALEAQLWADAARRPAAGSWIWAYHAPPDRSPTSWSGHRYYGDEVLNRLIDEHQPTVVLAGHVHESPFRADGSWHDRLGETLVLNAGRQPGPIPAHIILDTGRAEAMWWTFEAAETISTEPQTN